MYRKYFIFGPCFLLYKSIGMIGKRVNVARKMYFVSKFEFRIEGMYFKSSSSENEINVIALLSLNK